MRRMARRALALGLGVVLGGVAAAALVVVSDARPWSRLTLADVRGLIAQQVVNASAPERARAIAEELRTLAQHPWAGEYVTPGSWPDELLVAPDAGFTLYSGSYCGNCAGHRAVGRVRELDARGLKLEPLAATGSIFRDVRGPQVLHRVTWGEERLLVAESQVEAFCAQVTDGRSVPAAFWRRRLDVTGPTPVRPDGRPQLPERMRALAPEAPIECTVVALAAEPGPPGGDGAVNALFRLDRGSEAGLAVGMRLRVEGVRSYGRVESVERESATLRHWAGGRHSPMLDAFVGRAVRTLHPEPRHDD